MKPLKPLKLLLPAAWPVCLLLALAGLLAARPAGAAARWNPWSAHISNKPKHHAVFCDLKKARQARPDHTLRLYLDSHGSLYPAAGLLPSTAQLRADRRNTAATLEYFYQSRAGQALQNRLYAQDRYRLAPPTPNALGAVNQDTPAWEHLQDELVRGLAHQVDSATGQGRRPLVVLIHGFNVGEGVHTALAPEKPYYDRIRNMVEVQGAGQVPANAVWLEVYWDGMRKIPPGVWGAAQLNARYVGLRLRQVLAATNPTTPVRVLTHSLGGVVITQALWDNDAFSGGGANEAYLRQRMRQVATPAHPGIRVGMLLPAVTPLAFDYFGRRGPDTVAARPVSYRVVVGRNERDFIITKLGLGCGLLGATCLGSEACALYHAQQQAAPYPGQVRGLSLCTTHRRRDTPTDYRQRWTGLEEHAWDLYGHPQRQAVMAQFLRLVFADE